ncbi:MAG: heavy-metal-associated domain-containing protein [Flavobacteriales bacterium]
MKTTSKIATVLLFLAIAFTSVNAQETSKTNERKYVKVEVDGLACPFCAYGLEKKLKKVEGQEGLEINIQEGYATFHVPSENELKKKKLKTIVKDAGFSAKKVRFSESPFGNDD